MLHTFIYTYMYMAPWQRFAVSIKKKENNNFFYYGTFQFI